MSLYKGGSTKTVQQSIKNISRNIKAVAREIHHKRKKMTPVVLLP